MNTNSFYPIQGRPTSSGESWWTTAPREHFTELAESRTFRDVDALARGRRHRITNDRVLPEEIG